MAHFCWNGSPSHKTLLHYDYTRLSACGPSYVPLGCPYEFYQVPEMRNPLELNGALNWKRGLSFWSKVLRVHEWGSRSLLQDFCCLLVGKPLAHIRRDGLGISAVGMIQNVSATCNSKYATIGYCLLITWPP